MGELFRTELAKLNHPNFKTIRGRGLLNAVVIDHPDPGTAQQICMNLMENGMLAKPTHGDKIRFAPPLVINKEQILECIDLIARSSKI
jgi:ornithine--oxo-acid transaminase